MLEIFSGTLRLYGRPQVPKGEVGDCERELFTARDLEGS